MHELGRQVLHDQGPAQRAWRGYSDDDAFAVGLTSRGGLDVLVQRVDPEAHRTSARRSPRRPARRHRGERGQGVSPGPAVSGTGVGACVRRGRQVLVGGPGGEDGLDPRVIAVLLRDTGEVGDQRGRGCVPGRDVPASALHDRRGGGQVVQDPPQLPLPGNGDASVVIVPVGAEPFLGPRRGVPVDLYRGAANRSRPSPWAAAAMGGCTSSMESTTGGAPSATRACTAASPMARTVPRWLKEVLPTLTFRWERDQAAAPRVTRAAPRHDASRGLP